MQSRVAADRPAYTYQQQINQQCYLGVMRIAQVPAVHGSATPSRQTDLNLYIFLSLLCLHTLQFGRQASLF